jgi:hypothetical protein
MDQAVRQAMLKDNSIGRQLDLSFFDASNPRKLKVKLEIDTHPPAGTGTSWHYLDFPVDFEVCAQDLPSNYALKLHASSLFDPQTTDAAQSPASPGHQTLSKK